MGGICTRPAANEIQPLPPGQPVSPPTGPNAETGALDQAHQAHQQPTHPPPAHKEAPVLKPRPTFSESLPGGISPSIGSRELDLRPSAPNSPQYSVSVDASVHFHLSSSPSSRNATEDQKHTSFLQHFLRHQHSQHHPDFQLHSITEPQHRQSASWTSSPSHGALPPNSIKLSLYNDYHRYEDILNRYQRMDSDTSVVVHDSPLMPPQAAPLTPAQAPVMTPVPGGMAAPKPENEEERIQALLDYRILDSSAEAAFDSLALLASQICQTPIALVSFVDRERQWFKAKLGLDVPETSRDLAFCAHAILHDEILEVPDALDDYRFADNPLVLDGPKIRFYAGMPLINNEGLPLGTLCTIDTVPKSLTSEQKAALKILAQQTVAQLELRRHVARLTETMAQVHDAKCALEASCKLAETARDDAERARAEAERASLAKSEFLSSMSHEIRTPLAGILGSATLLSQTALTKEQSDYVQTISTSGDHLLTVINDILDYSKQESGKLELESQVIDCYQLIEQSIELSFRKEHELQLIVAIEGEPDESPLTPEFITRNLHSLVLSPVPELASSDPASPDPQPSVVSASDNGARPRRVRMPQMVLGDVTRLRQILVNVLSNSSKFTKAGSITVALKLSTRYCTPDSDGTISYDQLNALVEDGSVAREYWTRLHSGTIPSLPTESLPSTRFIELQFSVTDTGIGIPPNKIHRLFKAFSQVDSSTTREYGGTGLGLAISAKLVALHGGTMTCESDGIGKGTTFHFTLFTPYIHQSTVSASSLALALAAASSTGVASTPRASAILAPDDSGPIVNRPLALSESLLGANQVLLVTSHAAFGANIVTQLRRWGLEVLRFETNAAAAAFFRERTPEQIGRIATVLVDYVLPFVPYSPSFNLRSVESSPTSMPVSPKPAEQMASLLTPDSGNPLATHDRRDSGSNNTAANITPPSAGMHELAFTIRAYETRTNSTVSMPIVYLTSGHPLLSDLSSVDDLGLTFHRKPLLFTKLRTLFQSLLQKQSRSRRASPICTSRAGVLQQQAKLAEQVPVSILVAEDNKVSQAVRVQELLGHYLLLCPLKICLIVRVFSSLQINMKLALKMLQNMGYSPQPAFNGAEAIDMFKEQHLHFDLILCDMIMPQVDGLTASREILQYYKDAHPNEQPPIIIAMTASAMEADRKACEAAGMVDFVSKPVNLSALRATIARWAEKIIQARPSSLAGPNNASVSVDAMHIANGVGGRDAHANGTPQLRPRFLLPRQAQTSTAPLPTV